MNKLRKLICWLFGHRSICLYRQLWVPDHLHSSGGSMNTGWKCERCGHTFDEGWDA